jgi:hypothetical protein
MVDLEPSNELIQSGSGSAEMLIQRAIDANVPVESLEKLLEMRRVLKQEAAKEAFFWALAQFQNECPAIEKQVDVDNKYKYAPFEHIAKVIRPLLTKHGFSYTFNAEYIHSNNVTMQRVTCRLHREGHTESSEFTAPAVGTKLMNATQIAASALTYGKRYSLCGALGLTVGKDVDGYVPPEHGAPSRDTGSASAQTRDDRVDIDEAKELFQRWTTFRSDTGQSHIDDDWVQWFRHVTGVDDDVARDLSLWSRDNFSSACTMLQKLKVDQGV